MNKELRKVVKALEEQGFDTRLLANGHVEVRLNGKRVATISGTPSDRRSFANSLSYLRRAGFRWPPRR